MQALADQASGMNGAMTAPSNSEPKGGAIRGLDGVDIIDIRQVAVETNLREELLSLFHPKEGLRQLPTLLLYNERGLQLFEEVWAPDIVVVAFVVSR
jgi:hypothetical protein